MIAYRALGKQKYREENMSQFRFVRLRSHVDWLGIESRTVRERLASNRLVHGTALCRD
jgi:hypothetical protein